MNLSHLNQLRRSWRQNGGVAKLTGMFKSSANEDWIRTWISLHSFACRFQGKIYRCIALHSNQQWSCKDGIPRTHFSWKFTFRCSCCFYTKPYPKKRGVDCPYPTLGYWIQWLKLPIHKYAVQRWKQSSRYEKGSELGEIYIQITLLPIIIMEVPNAWK